MNESAITPFAWIFMLLSMGAVTALAVACYWRILFGSAGTELTEPGTGERGED